MVALGHLQEDIDRNILLRVHVCYNLQHFISMMNCLIITIHFAFKLTSLKTNAYKLLGICGKGTIVADKPKRYPFDFRL